MMKKASILLSLYFLLIRVSLADIFFASFEAQVSLNRLFVVMDKKVFTRVIDNGQFIYQRPNSGCYKLENNLTICTDIDSTLISINNIRVNDPRFADVVAKLNNNTDSISPKDLFFKAEDTLACNKLKFQVVDSFILDKKPFYGLEFQLFVPGLFDVIRMYIIEDTERKLINNISSRPLLSYIISSNKSIECTKDQYFKLYTNNKKKPQDEMSELVAKHNNQQSMYGYAMAVSSKSLILATLQTLEVITSEEDKPKANIIIDDIKVTKLDKQIIDKSFNDIYFSDLNWK